MKKIKLTKDEFALVDDEDFEYLNQFAWQCSPLGYATRRIGMHREIIKTPKGMYTDHINGNPLDNRKENLRIVTFSQNMLNRKRYKNNKSGHKGVVWNKDRQKWRVRIDVKGMQIDLGSFRFLEEAKKAYNFGSLKYHKEFGRLNA